MFIIVFGIFVAVAIVGAIWTRKAQALILVLFGMAASLLTVGVVDMPVNWIMRDKIDFSYSLGALNDGQSIHGSFFLGSGTIDSVPSFMFYAKDGDGYVLRSWSANSSRVVETNAAPSVVYHCDDYSGVPRPFRWAAEFVNDNGSPYDCRHGSVTFYVPPGSVKQQYNLDAQ